MMKCLKCHKMHLMSPNNKKYWIELQCSFWWNYFRNGQNSHIITAYVRRVLYQTWLSWIEPVSASAQNFELNQPTLTNSNDTKTLTWTLQKISQLVETSFKTLEIVVQLNVIFLKADQDSYLQLGKPTCKKNWRLSWIEPVLQTMSQLVETSFETWKLC